MAGNAPVRVAWWLTQDWLRVRPSDKASPRLKAQAYSILIVQYIWLRVTSGCVIGWERDADLGWRDMASQEARRSASRSQPTCCCASRSLHGRQFDGLEMAKMKGQPQLCGQAPFSLLRQAISRMSRSIGDKSLEWTHGPDPDHGTGAMETGVM